MTNPFNKKGFTLVELMIVVAIIGILAALAIPAFLRYIKTSKAAEAEQTMKKIADGGKAYYTSEQRYTPTSGDQPWHKPVTTAVNTQAGMPVPFTGKVFPGGTTAALAAWCSHLAAAGACNAASYPINGEKRIPLVETAASATLQTRNKLRASFADPTYFAYDYAVGASAGKNASATVKAYANFKDSTTPVHTVIQTMQVDNDSQEAIVIPAYIENEFE